MSSADSIAELVRAVAAAGATAEARAGLELGWRGQGEVSAPARALDQRLREHTATAAGVAGHVIAADDRGRAVVAAWCRAVAGDPSLVLSSLITALSHADETSAEVEAAARERVRRGPLRDALACVPLGGSASWLARAEAAPARARLELLAWEAGELAASVPEIGRWLFRDALAFKQLVLDAASGPLLARAVAARIIELGADGVRAPEIPPSTHVALERALRRLGAHPDPAVWIPALRAIGRLAPQLAEVRGLLEEWVESKNPGERRRAVTALASMPTGAADRHGVSLEAMLDDSDPWVVAALGPAIPHLASESRDVWQRLLVRMDKDPPGPEALFGVTAGLAALRRREGSDRLGDRLLRAARSRALAAQPRSATEAQLWLAILRHTDFLDQLEPDPGDPQRVLEGLASAAARVGAERVAERARFVARSLRGSFETALPAAASAGTVERRAASCMTIESCARAAALTLWDPIMRAADLPVGGLSSETDEACAAMVRALAPRMAGASPEHSFQRSGFRVLGSAADGGTAELGAVLTAFEHAPGLAEPGRLVKRFKKPIADLLWRAVDATRLHPLVPDPMLYPRFAAWWSLSSSVGGSVLEHLGRSEVAAREGGDEGTLEAVASIRELLSPTAMGAVEGAWALKVLTQLERLGAGETNLAEGLSELASALDLAVESRTFRSLASLELALSMLADAADRVRALLADPRIALGPAHLDVDFDGEPAGPSPRAAEVAELARAVRQATRFEAGEYAERWSAGLGPLLSPLVARAVELLLSAHVGVEATEISRSDATLGGYRLIRKLGEGQMGAVWLVCDPNTERHFVMKLPVTPYAETSDQERAFLDEAVGLEADILKSIHHPNVANLIDYGFDSGTAFMVLEYLAGVDLEAYLGAGLMTLDELKLVVEDVAAGLRALHARGLVHRDLKPGNIFMRLDLGPPGTLFDPRSHRDVRVTPPLAAVIIDFGLASTRRTSEDGERTALGTLGFMPPEQARGITNIDGRADVYALAATVYAAVTGAAFYESRGLTTREWLKAHALEEPLEGDPRADDLPPAMRELLAQAGARDPARRPDVAEFAARFAALE